MLLLAVQACGRTAEGPSDGTRLTPLQAALAERHGSQAEIAQSWMVVGTASERPVVLALRLVDG